MSETYEAMLLISQAVRSNLSLSEAIRLSIVDNRSSRLNRSLLRFADQLDKGQELPVAAQSAGLPKKLTVLLEAARKSGDFPDYFAELTDAEQSRTKTTRTLMNLISYPLFLIFVMLVAIGIGAFIVPQFDKIFRDFDTELPALTILIITIGKFFLVPQTYIIAGVSIVAFFVLQRLFFPTFWFYFPILGRIFWTLASEKLLRQLLVSLKYHMPLDEAFRLAARSFQLNRVLYRDCRQAADLAREGAKLSLIVSLFPILFPTWLLPIIRMAEKNDTVPSALRHGITILEEDRTGSTMLFGTALVPLFCFSFVFFAGVFIFAMILPLLKLITSLSG